MKITKIITYLLIIAAVVAFSGCDGNHKYTPPPVTEKAHLNITTIPVAGDIYIDQKWMGKGSWEGDVTAERNYEISFGDVPSEQESRDEGSWEYRRWDNDKGDWVTENPPVWKPKIVTVVISYTKPAPINVYLYSGDDRNFTRTYTVQEHIQ